LTATAVDRRWPKRRKDRTDPRLLGQLITARCAEHPGAVFVGTFADSRIWFREHEQAEHGN